MLAAESNTSRGRRSTFATTKLVRRDANSPMADGAQLPIYRMLGTIDGMKDFDLREASIFFLLLLYYFLKYYFSGIFLIY